MHVAGSRSASLIAVLSCRESAGLHGEGAPASNAGAPPPAAGARPGAKTARPHLARGSVSEAEALKPRPDLLPDRARAGGDRRRAGAAGAAQPGSRRSRRSPGEERWIDAEAAEAAGYTLVDLSDDWTPYIFAEQTGPDGQPLPNRYRRIFIGLANDQLDEDGEPLPPGDEELPRALRHLPVAVGAARALPRRRAAPLPRPGERRRARRRRDGHLRRAGRRQEGRAPPVAHPPGAGRGAHARRTPRRWTSWRRSSRPTPPR